MKSKSAKRRDYNPELYCNLHKLPRHIRWEKVVASAEFVIRNCDLNPLRLKLQILQRDFTRIIKTEENKANRISIQNK